MLIWGGGGEGRGFGVGTSLLRFKFGRSSFSPKIRDFLRGKRRYERRDSSINIYH